MLIKKEKKLKRYNLRISQTDLKTIEEAARKSNAKSVSSFLVGSALLISEKMEKANPKTA